MTTLLDSQKLSESTLNWLLYPRLAIAVTARDELFELSCQLANIDTPGPAHSLFEEIEKLFLAMGNGGYGLLSIGRPDLDTWLEVDHIANMHVMYTRAPFFGKIPLTQVALPSDHPVTHAAVAVYVQYIKLAACSY